MSKKNGKKINKTQYVLAHGKLTAAELVAQAKKEKIVLSEKYVYNIRSKAKGNANVGSGKSGRKPGRKSGKKDTFDRAAKAVERAAAVYESAKPQAFVEAALNLGLDKAEALINKLKAAVASVV